MTQGNMFPPIARNTDPNTSHTAAQQVTNRESLVARITRAVRLKPGLTRGELAEYLNEPQDRVWRRVSDAVTQGYIRYGAPRMYNGRSQQTIWPPQ